MGEVDWQQGFNFNGMFSRHRLSLPEWMDEWSFLGSVFLGHFHWVSTENTGYWYVSSRFRLHCSPPPKLP